jgi:CysZ protein
MNFFGGIGYNLRGLWFGLKTPKLLLLGLLRLATVVLITIVAASLILVFHDQILNQIWSRPESHWLIWLWYVLSWLLALALIGISAVVSYIVAQIVFSVFIMDMMSRVTERMHTGKVEEPLKMAFVQQFFHLVKQEIPRTTVPVLVILLLTVVGWFTPIGPLLTVISAGIAVIFLAWDHTDLVPARRMQPFKQRFKILLSTLPFHLGFGLPFLIPVLNLLLLSFAPIGATLYYLDKHPG